MTNSEVQGLFKAFEDLSQDAITFLHTQLFQLKDGKAHPALVENILVECYGSKMPMHQMASVKNSGPSTLSITPWDKNNIKPIEKSIANSGLGLNPTNNGEEVFLTVPPLTSDRQAMLVKLIKKHRESAAISIRQHRKNTKKELGSLKLSEDELRQAVEELQSLTEVGMSEINHLTSVKEKTLTTNYSSVQEIMDAHNKK